MRKSEEIMNLLYGPAWDDVVDFLGQRLKWDFDKIKYKDINLLKTVIDEDGEICHKVELVFSLIKDISVKDLMNRLWMDYVKCDGTVSCVFNTPRHFWRKEL